MEQRNLKSLLFITLVNIDSIDNSNIYADLLRYFLSKNYKVTIVSPLERRSSNKPSYIEGENYRILRPKTLNNQKVNKVEKLLSILSIDYIIQRTIKKELRNGTFDLLIYSTPPITLTKTISYCRKNFKCKTFLLLKDIFPQNAVDLGMMTKSSFIYKFFRKKEEQLYELSDGIGCMSQNNVDYVLTNNPFIDKQKINIAPNSMELPQEGNKRSDAFFRSKHDIPKDSTVFIYGGNLGKPQGINVLIEILDHFQKNQKVFFFIIGSGTEYDRINDWFDRNNPRNVILKSYLPKEEYDQYVSNSDVGLIFLDSKFTIPNYPSRLLGYLAARLPVLSFTDLNSDIGSNAKSRNYGDWAYSGDLSACISLIDAYMDKDNAKLKEMGNTGYNYFKKHYQPENTFSSIVNIVGD